jgi:putative addiction module component (TIGR02574 family)
MTTVDRLYEEAMQLPGDQRELLAYRLLDCLEKDPGYDEYWEQELRRRDAEVESGEVELLEWDEVRAMLHGPTPT